MPTSQTAPTDNLEPRSSWPSVAAGLFIFIIAGSFLLISEIPPRWGAVTQPALSMLAYWGMLLVPAMGCCAGWMLGFPRWSYPYAGLSALIALYMANASTPGLTFLGSPTFGEDVWGIRALIPLCIAFLIAWIATRSLQPLGTFFIQMTADRTLPVYSMTGFLPLVAFVAFDEIDSRYTVAFYRVILFALLLMAGLYLRSQTTVQRSLTLAIGIIAIIAIITISTSVYWYRLGPGNVNLSAMLAWAVCIIGFLLWPLATPGIARTLDRNRQKNAF